MQRKVVSRESWLQDPGIIDSVVLLMFYMCLHMLTFLTKFKTYQNTRKIRNNEGKCKTYRIKSHRWIFNSILLIRFLCSSSYISYCLLALSIFWTYKNCRTSIKLIQSRLIGSCVAVRWTFKSILFIFFFQFLHSYVILSLCMFEWGKDTFPNNPLN